MPLGFTKQPITQDTSAIVGLMAAFVPLAALSCRLVRWRSRPAGSPWCGALLATDMLRIHGDRDSLLASLAAHWADQQLQIDTTPKPVVRPIRRRSRPPNS
jgi:hypothetical protein